MAGQPNPVTWRTLPDAAPTWPAPPTAAEPTAWPNPAATPNAGAAPNHGAAPTWPAPPAGPGPTAWPTLATPPPGPAPTWPAPVGLPASMTIPTVPPPTGWGGPPVGPAHSPAPAGPRLRQPSARSAEALAGDDARVRQASIHVGLYVAFATAITLLVGCGLFLLYVVHSQTRSCVMTSPIGPWQRLPYETGIDPCAFGIGHYEYLINPRQIIVAVIILFAACAVLMGLIGWLTARRAVLPLAEALRLQRHFVADASHELRTPLTVLSTRIQLLQRKLDRGDEVGTTVTKLRDDAAGMTDVLNDLLLTVEGSQDAASPTAVQPVVRQAVNSLQVVADQAGVRLQVSAGADPSVTVPAQSLSRAIVALVDNAIQHSPADSVVAVSIAQEGAEVAIRVRDHGPGIGETDPSRMFERFAHGAETGRKRSFGLGLALVSEIAQRNGGDILIESTGPDGTTFLLRFPASMGSHADR